MISLPWDVISQFDLGDTIGTIEPFGDGLINDTYLLTTGSPDRAKIILQRINPHVFPQPERLMENLQTLLRHIESRSSDGATDVNKLQFPRLYASHEQKSLVVDKHGNYWRAQSFINNTYTLKTTDKLTDASEVGRALGLFHQMANDLDPALLHNALPDFHITPRYFQRFEKIRIGTTKNTQPLNTDNSQDLQFCLNFVETRKSLINILEAPKQAGDLPLRTIHGDPKLNNVLFNIYSHRAVSLIDLDTVQPGLIHYDVGDCLRSCCGRIETADMEPLSFSLPFCRAILESYLKETRDFLTIKEQAFFYDAIHLIPFELGLRFLTDYLEDNPYFKVDTPNQNLNRAKKQFQLTASIERQKQEIKTIISEITGI